MIFQPPYRGRFAPSPTGPLHFGSLIAATGSYLQAKRHQGEWLVRIDDIDPPRTQKGASKLILEALEDFGFEWDHDVVYQSTRHKRYQDAVNDLIKRKKAYFCSCSRQSILNKTGQIKGQGEIIYPGFCRDKSFPDSDHASDYSVRLRCNEKSSFFIDNLQGQQNFNLKEQRGDFIIQRRDRYFAYHLASGIDDVEQNITEVVRGADLLSSTPCQIYIQQELNLESPQYSHLPIIVDETGQKLSKQSHAAPIKPKDSVLLLYKTLKFLGQMPPIELKDGNQKDIWNWAQTHWQIELVPAILQITINRNEV